jgi:hypothetical protein
MIDVLSIRRREAGSMGAVIEDGWVALRRSDVAPVIEMVRAVAEAADPGEFGDGVEVVIETPPPGRLSRLVRRRPRAQARLVVTKAGGAVAYPFEIQIVSEHLGGAARRVGAGPGWATSNSAGLAFLIQKGQMGARPDFEQLVGTAVAALVKLRPRSTDRGWRAIVERGVSRR